MPVEFIIQTTPLEFYVKNAGIWLKEFKKHEQYSTEFY